MTHAFRNTKNSQGGQENGCCLAKNTLKQSRFSYQMQFKAFQQVFLEYDLFPKVEKGYVEKLHEAP